MHEVVNHLWQSTVFTLIMAACAAMLRNYSARTRYWLWMAASVKFLIPFSLLVSAGTKLEDKVPQARVAAVRVEQISRSFAPAPLMLPPAAAPARALTGTRFWPVFWMAGSLFLVLRWTRRWYRLHCLKRAAVRRPHFLPIPVLITEAAIEPGVFGLLRPVLLLPEGIDAKLTAEQFDAILAHELSHVRSYDNLTAAFHMVVESVFWFHPLVWWIGSKLVAERERACDESVLQRGSSPQVYAQGILNVCRFCAESPLPCANGVTGASLKERITQILTIPVTASRRLSTVRMGMLAAAGIAALALPVAIGILRAQTLPPEPKFTYEVASVRPSKPGEPGSRIMPGPQGGMRTQNTLVTQLINFTYEIADYQLAGGPDWIRSDRFDVEFTPDKAESMPTPGAPKDVMEGFIGRNRQRMQAVLRDRFGLVLRAETRQLPMYALTIAKGGHKLTRPAEGSRPGPRMRFGRGELDASGAYLNMLSYRLGDVLGRYVADETGLEGAFDFKMHWAPEPGAPGGPGDPGASSGGSATGTEGPSLFTALTEQLGLRLESKKGPVHVFVIEKIEKPGAN